MIESFAIKSTSSNREICFSKFDGEDFYVELKGDINATTKIYEYAPHSYNLSYWFAELGKQVTTWEDTKVWESLEGELKISATCTLLGRIHFLLALRMLPEADEETFIQVGLESELGQITNISNEARKFFEK